MASIEKEMRDSRRAAEDIAGPRYDPKGTIWKPTAGSTPKSGEVDFSGLKTTGNRAYDSSYISYIDRKLREGGLGRTKRAAVLANIVEESGGNPFALDETGQFYGLLQWADNRYKPTGEKDPYKEIDNQVKYILSSMGNTTDRVSWTHGGEGSGYNSLNDAVADFNNEDLATSMKGYTLGHVRPTGKMDSYNNRLKVAEQIYSLEGFQ